MNTPRSTLFGLGYVGISEVVARLAHFVTFAISTRYLSPAGFGIYGTAWAIYNMAIPLVQGGPELLGTRDLAQDGQTRARIAEITALKLALAICAMAVIVIVAFTIYRDDAPLRSQIVVQSLVLIGIAIGPGWAARGLQRFDIHAWIRVSQAGAMAILCYAALPLIADPSVVALAEMASFLIAFWLGVHLLATPVLGTDTSKTISWSVLLPTRWRDLKDGLSRYLRASAVLSFSGLASAVEMSACIPIAGYFLSAEKTGIVSAVLRLLFFMLAQFQVLLQVFYPRLSALYASDRDRGRDLAMDLFVYFSIVSVVATAALILLAEPIVRLVLGESYLQAIPLLRLLSPILIAVGAGSVFGYVLLASGKHVQFTISNVGGAIVLVPSVCISYLTFPTSTATVVLLPILFLQAGVQALICHRYDLIRIKSFSFRRLTPSYLINFLKS